MQEPSKDGSVRQNRARKNPVLKFPERAHAHCEDAVAAAGNPGTRKETLTYV